MSIIMMLERVAEGARVENSTPAAVADQHIEPSPLKIFNGEPTVDSLEADGVLPSRMASFLGGMNGPTHCADEFDEDASGGATLSLEKAWHGLHFLLTSDSRSGAGLRSFLVSGGVEQGDDHGYGPARYFTPEETREIAKVLSPIDAVDLWSRFDAQSMTDEGIYPGIWDELAADLEEEYCDYFEQLQAFMSEAAEQGAGLLVYLT